VLAITSIPRSPGVRLGRRLGSVRRRRREQLVQLVQLGQRAVVERDRQRAQRAAGRLAPLIMRLLDKEPDSRPSIEQAEAMLAGQRVPKRLRRSCLTVGG
jgi:hypothetical protein